MIKAGMVPSWAKGKAQGKRRLWNAHHVIPVELEEHAVLNALRDHEPGWDHNAAENGYPLPVEPTTAEAEQLPVHQVTRDIPRRGGPAQPEPVRDLPGHPVWNQKVKARLDALKTQPSKVAPGKLLIDQPGELRTAVLDLIVDLKGEIELSQARGIPVLF